MLEGTLVEDPTSILTLDSLKKRSAAVEGESCIVFLYPAGQLVGRRVTLAQPEYVIGRIPPAHIVIDRESVSRRHAKIVNRNFAWMMEDLNSTNGVFVNEHRVTSQILSDGDIVRIGDTTFKFLSGDNLEAAYHEEIYRLTILDPLTEVNNRRYFAEFLEREMAAATRYSCNTSLIMMDIDHFKKINDTYGHVIGDIVLKVVASRIKPRIRREDLLARYGGEEFAIILTHTDLPGALAFAESVRRLFSDIPVVIESLRIPVTLSLGVATAAPSSGMDSTTFIKAADENLYKSKQGGRNRVTG